MELVLLHPFHLFYAHYRLLFLKKIRKIRPWFVKFHPKYPFLAHLSASRPKNSAICCLLHNFAIGKFKQRPALYRTYIHAM